MDEDLALRLLRLVLDGDSAKNSLTDHLIGQWVIVRTYSAGVHFGKLAARTGEELILRDTRRIHGWSGAFTLSEIALLGVETARMPRAIPEIFLPSHIEIIKCSDQSARQLRDIPHHEIN